MDFKELPINKRLPLKNRFKKVIGYTRISPEHYNILKHYKWHRSQGYVAGYVNKQKVLLHRYIILDICKKEIPKGYIVDHLNNNNKDNRIENLIIVPKTYDNTKFGVKERFLIIMNKCKKFFNFHFTTKT